MGLTSGILLALAGLLAAVLFIGTLVLWPRLSRRTPGSWLGRVGLLFATQLAIFVVAALAVNQSFLFYGSWGDLLGRQQALGRVVDASVNASGVDVVGSQPTGVPGSPSPSRAGLIQKFDIAGATSHVDSSGYVYLPPQYFLPQYRRQRFPVALVLTGYPGIPYNLIKELNFPGTAWTLAKEDKAQPMILVMMTPNVASPRDTECVNIPGGPQVETFLSHDVPRQIAKRFRAGTTLGNWGVIGYSTGGYCALQLAVRNPHQFSAGVGMSAYYHAESDVTTGNLFHGNRELRDHSNLVWDLQHLPRPTTSLLVTSSLKGESDLQITRAFIRDVKPPTHIAKIILKSGGHNFGTWRREIPAALQWMSPRMNLE